jgi:hypothetical protein
VGEFRPVYHKLIRSEEIETCTPLGTRGSFQQMPSRKAVRKAKSDAAKGAPGRVGAAGTAGAAAALANVSPLGDWKTQAEDPAVGLAHIASPRHIGRI